LLSLLFRSIWLWGTWQWQRERAGARTSSKKVTTRASVVPVTFVFASNTTTTTTTKREQETAPRGTTNEPSLFAPVRLAYQPPTNQQYFSLETNQPSASGQRYFSLRKNQHQPPATSQTNRLMSCLLADTPPRKLKEKYYS
jgi:hypothetical protein